MEKAIEASWKLAANLDWPIWVVRWGSLLLPIPSPTAGRPSPAGRIRKRMDPSCDKSPEMRKAPAKQAEREAQFLPPKGARSTIVGNTPARIAERTQETQPPVPISCDDSQAKALVTNNAWQQKMWNTLGIGATTELSPFNAARTLGHLLTHVTLDMFTSGAWPKCNVCESTFQLGARAWTSYRCVFNFWTGFPIPKGVTQRGLQQGFALCVECAYRRFEEDDSSIDKPTLAPIPWKHTSMEEPWDSYTTAMSHTKIIPPKQLVFRTCADLINKQKLKRNCSV